MKLTQYVGKCFIYTKQLLSDLTESLDALRQKDYNSYAENDLGIKIHTHYFQRCSEPLILGKQKYVSCSVSFRWRVHTDCLCIFSYIIIQCLSNRAKEFQGSSIQTRFWGVIYIEKIVMCCVLCICRRQFERSELLCCHCIHFVAATKLVSTNNFIVSPIIY